MTRMLDAAASLAADTRHQPWSGSSGGSCVETRALPDGRYALLRSHDPDGPALIFTRIELDVFSRGWEAWQTRPPAP